MSLREFYRHVATSRNVLQEDSSDHELKEARVGRTKDSLDIRLTSSVCVPPSDRMHVAFSAVSVRLLRSSPGFGDREPETCIGGRRATLDGGSYPTNPSFMRLVLSITCCCMCAAKIKPQLGHTKYRAVGSKKKPVQPNSYKG